MSSDELEQRLEELNRNIDLVTTAEILFDGFYVGNLAKGIYRAISGKDTTVESELADIVLKYRTELVELRQKYQKEKEGFLGSIRNNLNKDD